MSDEDVRDQLLRCLPEKPVSAIGQLHQRAAAAIARLRAEVAAGIERETKAAECLARTIDQRDAARALLVPAWEAGRDAAREMVDCGCENRAALLDAAKQGHNSAARWQACGNPVCAALDALAIAALPPPPDIAEQLSKERGE